MRPVRCSGTNTKFSVYPSTSLGLREDDGGYAVGFDGWMSGGTGFLSYSLSTRLKVGFALAGNYGATLDYDNTGMFVFALYGSGKL